MLERATVTTFVACDRVIEEANTRKKSVIGIFSNFHFEQLPARPPFPWFLFAQIKNLADGQHDITVNIVHDETQAVVFSATIEVKEEHPESVDLVLPVIAEFQKKGQHVVSLNIGGQQKAYFILSVEIQKRTLGG